MEGIFASRGQAPPDWRDWDHLHAHYLQDRDIFITWDGAILAIAADLQREFGIIVLPPETYLLQEILRSSTEIGFETAPLAR